jgi:hypothetical protein
MPVRLATARDIPVMASVLAAAFGPDKLFQVLFPFQREHPGDFERALRESLWLSWYDYGKVLMVSYSNDAAAAAASGPESENTALLSSSTGKKMPSLSLRPSDRKEGGTVTGMAEWERVVHGIPSAGARACHMNGFLGWWDPRKFQTITCAIRYKILTRIARQAG